MSSKTKAPKTLTNWFVINGGIIKQGICITFKETIEYKTKDELSYLQKKLANEKLTAYQDIYGNDIGGYYVDGKKSSKTEYELDTEFKNKLSAVKYGDSETIYKISISDITTHMRSIFETKCHKLKTEDDDSDDENDAEEQKKSKTKTKKASDDSDDDEDDKKAKKATESKKSKEKKEEVETKKSKSKDTKKEESEDEVETKKSKSKDKKETKKKEDSEDELEEKKTKKDDKKKDEKKKEETKKSKSKDDGKIVVAKPSAKIVIESSDSEMSEGNGH